MEMGSNMSTREQTLDIFTISCGNFHFACFLYNLRPMLTAFFKYVLV